VKLNNVKGSRGKRTSVGNRRHTYNRTQTKTAKTKRKRNAQRHVSRKSRVAKPLRKNAPNGRIEPLSSREQNLRGNNARKIGKTGKNRGTEKNKCVVRRKKWVAKTLKEMLMGLGHAT
jgi:hypothetical protein